MRPCLNLIILTLAAALAVAVPALPQSVKRELRSSGTAGVEIENPNGKVSVTSGEEVRTVSFTATTPSGQSLRPDEISEDLVSGRARLVVRTARDKRVDIDVRVPKGASVSVRTIDGEVRLSGPIGVATVNTETGTIATDLPLTGAYYRFTWTESRPRILSSIELEEAKEGKAGRFVAEGFYRGDGSVESGTARLNLTTGRGIVLVNVNPDEVPSSLQERPLTEAAKAIIRSGDSILTSAIRRVSPKYFGDYSKTLPPPRMPPALGRRASGKSEGQGDLRSLIVQVVDASNRAVADVGAAEFQVTENGERREIVDVRPASAPFDLVLLLDVSGSIENYVDFIRKAARAFIDTSDPRDRIAIVVFNDDVKVLSGFSGDRVALSASLDKFEAGGGTAYYDALGFVFVELLESLQNDRTAIVVLSDGDDNRSFLPFESLTGPIEEGGALIYPLYVPSGLIANSRLGEPESSVDPLRGRYMSLTSKSEREGARLAEVSGGRYYPIRNLSEIQLAYDDIARQLRTAYSVTYRTGSPSGRVKVSVGREGINTKFRSAPTIR